MSWPTIPCHSCSRPTTAERKKPDGVLRSCRSGHRAVYSGTELVRIWFGRQRLPKRCWCGAKTRYLPCGRLIASRRGKIVYAMKRECSRGHRSWFQRSRDGGQIIRKVDTR